MLTIHHLYFLVKRYVVSKIIFSLHIAISLLIWYTLTIPIKEETQRERQELRRIIGGRAKQRRLELGVNQPYVAEKMGVTASTIQRYEAGTIDNTKKLVLDGLADALHVSVEWLKGETEEYESDITDKRKC